MSNQGRNQQIECEIEHEIERLRRDGVLMDVGRWVRLQNSLLKWTPADLEWHDRIVEERPLWAVDLIDAEAMEKERWGMHRQRSVV